MTKTRRGQAEHELRNRFIGDKVDRDCQSLEMAPFEYAQSMAPQTREILL
jgi:hypothetical protein